MELGDQQSSARLEDPVHLLDGGLLIIFGHVVQSQGARNRVEGAIREREVLSERDLEGRGYSALARPAGGTFDHLCRWVDAVD